MKPASERILTPSSSIGSEIRTFNIGSTVRACSWRLCQRRSQLPQERLSSDCYRVPDGSQRWRIACLNLRKILNGQSEMGCHGATLRCNFASMAAHLGLTVQDFSEIETCYCPPLAPVWDSVTIAAYACLR